MSGKTTVIIGVVILVLVVAGVILFTQFRPQQAMANGPGVLYFYSPV
jgi:hypothetical protein